MKKVNIIQAINDKHLFQPLFRDLETWSAWLVSLKALFGLALADDELALYQACTGRERAPDKPFAEAWAPTGRRSGKSFIAALVAVFLACFKDYTPHLTTGERAMILVIAADRSQAQIIFRYVKAFLDANCMMRKLVEAERAESIDLANRITIQVATCSYRSIRGFTAAAVIADEIGFWRSEVDSANPANEVLRAIRPSLATIPESLLLCISSPWARTGPLYETFNRHHGKDDSDVLVWNADTPTMNPTIRQSIIERDMELDPEMALCEWGAEFRSDLESFLSLEAIEAAVVQGRYELPPIHGTRYQAFVDPSGGRRDAATLAVAHKDGQRVILDMARRWRAPYNPADVVLEMANVLRPYGIYQVVGDRYAGEWPRQEFQKHHIRYEVSDKDKSGLYIDFLPLVLSQSVELLENNHLLAELRSLERRARSAGRDLVDHPPRGTDDLANAVAGVCARLGARSQHVSVVEQASR
jgi:hypothetical protein